MNTVDTDSLARTIGVRLRAARLAAKMPATSVAERLGYQGQTQVSLAESGGRIPPLPILMAYADLYVVPLDFLCGRMDDPIADSAETNQGVIVNVLAEAMQEQFSRLVNSVAEQASVTIAGYNQDRRDLQMACSAAMRVRTALKRVRELSPEFDDDWRGTATLVRELENLATLAVSTHDRLARERRMRETVDQELSLSEMSDKARKGIVQLTLTAEQSYAAQ
ncbi:helix-turn-helix domain-containing protein [Stutzerimonas kunmingensis]|uniref:helix-turn-helix domain-containing protein n=1 Tax=Stutzerimonas kunmingensis TaxID=1211807 RepID=UPI0037D2A77A